MSIFSAPIIEFPNESAQKDLRLQYEILDKPEGEFVKVTVELECFMPIIDLKNAGYNRIKFDIKPDFEIEALADVELPSGLDLTTYLNLFETYAGLDAEAYETYVPGENCIFYNNYSINEFISDSEIVHPPPNGEIEYSYLAVSPGKYKGYTSEPKEIKRLGSNNTAAECFKNILLNTSDSIVSLGECKFPAAFNEYEKLNEVTVGPQGTHRVGSEELSDDFWEYWKKFYSYNPTVGRLQPVIKNSTSSMRAVQFRAKFEIPADTGATASEVRNILGQTLKLNVEVYEEIEPAREIPLEVLSYGTRVDLLEAAANTSRFANTLAGAYTIGEAGSFDQVILTNTNSSIPQIAKVYLKYYDASTCEVSTGLNSVVEIPPNGTTTLDVAIPPDPENQLALRYYEAIQYDYFVGTNGHQVIRNVPMSRTAFTPKQVRDATTTSVYCSYSLDPDPYVSITGGGFPVDTEEYKFYLDKPAGGRVSQRNPGNSRGKYQYLGKKSADRRSHFKAGMNLSSGLPPGNYRVIVDALANDCITQTMVSVFTVDSSGLETASANFSVLVTPMTYKDKITINDTSTGSPVATTVLSQVDTTFSEFFAEDYSNLAPQSQIVSYFKIYRLNNLDGKYTDVSPSSAGYGGFVGPGVYDISTPKIGKHEKDYTYFVRHYAFYAGNLTVANFPFVESNREGAEGHYYDYFKYRSPQTIKTGVLPALQNLSSEDKAMRQYTSCVENSLVGVGRGRSTMSHREIPTGLTFSVENFFYYNKLTIDFNSRIGNENLVDKIVVIGNAEGYQSIVSVIEYDESVSNIGKVKIIDKKLASILGTIYYRLYFMLTNGEIVPTDLVAIASNNNNKLQQLYLVPK